MRRKIELAMILLFLIGALVFSRKISTFVSGTAAAGKSEVYVVLDAGHGGERMRKYAEIMYNGQAFLRKM